MKRKLISAILAVCLTSISAPLLAAQGRPAASTALTAQEAADLTYIREEEKLARDTYLVFFDQWGTTIFSNIASSEQRHTDAVLGLLRKYRLPDPAAGNAIGEFTDPGLQTLYLNLNALGMQSEIEALRVGGVIEETDIRDLKVSIANTTHADIVKVYENLFCGSRNHLRSFAGTITAMTGQAYTALVLPQAEVDAVLSSPMERCGQ
jgi:hypothetical protein